MTARDVIPALKRLRQEGFRLESTPSAVLLSASGSAILFLNC